MTETAFLRVEIAHARKHLRRWMRAKRVAMPLSLQPASARIVPQPLGLVLVIAPWNYPVQLLLSPLVSALAAGNAVILKPSEVASHCSALLARHIPEYLDQDAVAVVEGGVAETTALLALPFDHIFYTGNGQVARDVLAAAAKHLTPVTLELGGKCPAWVDESIDLETTARRLVWAKFLNAGQTCVAPDHVLGTAQTLARLKPLLVEAIRAQFGVDPAQSADYGRIINARHFDRLSGMIEGKGGITGGFRDAASRYFEPTLVEGVAADDALMQTEIFGPILPLVAVDGIEDGVDQIRSRGKPLAVYAFTSDAQIRATLQARTASGALVFNMAVGHLGASNIPFGGVGESGYGASHGEAGFRTFSHFRPVVHKPAWPDTLRLIMPPYGATVDRVIRYLMAKES